MYKNNDFEIETRINKEIDNCNMAYKIKDTEGNVFVYGYMENGYPVYRTSGGSKHIFDLTGFKVIEKHIKL